MIVRSISKKVWSSESVLGPEVGGGGGGCVKKEGSSRVERMGATVAAVVVVGGGAAERGRRGLLIFETERLVLLCQMQISTSVCILLLYSVYCTVCIVQAIMNTTQLRMGTNATR